MNSHDTNTAVSPSVLTTKEPKVISEYKSKNIDSIQKKVVIFE